MSTANYSQLITAVLSEAYREFGKPTPETRDDIAAWVRWRVNEIREGRGKAPDELPAVKSIE